MGQGSGGLSGNPPSGNAPSDKEKKVYKEKKSLL